MGGGRAILKFCPTHVTLLRQPCVQPNLLTSISDLATLAIEKEVAQQLDYNKIIDEFASLGKNRFCFNDD